MEREVEGTAATSLPCFIPHRHFHYIVSKHVADRLSTRQSVHTGTERMLSEIASEMDKVIVGDIRAGKLRPRLWHKGL